MDYHMKRQKKGHYLLHPSLIEYRRQNWAGMWQLNALVLVISGLFGYMPTHLMAFDLMMTVLVVGFWLLGLPYILKGKAPFQTYYKRTYQVDNFLYISKLVVHGAIVRTVLYAVFFVSFYLIERGDKFAEQSVVNDVLDILFSPVAQSVAILVFLYLFHYMFIKDKYVKIEEFTKQVVNIIKEENAHFTQAVWYFIQRRDEALDKEWLDGVKYETETHFPQETVKDNRQNSTNNGKTFYQEKLYEEPAPIRRQSRR